MRTLNHFGIPTDIPKEGEAYLSDLKLYVTDISSSPNKIEFLRFEADSPMPDLIKKQAHIAYVVDDIDAEMAGKPVLWPKTVMSDELTIAFIEEEGIAIELMLCAQ